MTAVGERFWAALDKQASSDSSRETEKPTQPHISPVPASLRGDPEPEPVRMPVAAPEWSGVLDIINGARVHAEAQKDQLLAQAETFRGAIADLRREAEVIREQVRVAEAQVAEAKAEAERQVASSWHKLRTGAGHPGEGRPPDCRGAQRNSERRGTRRCGGRLAQAH